jgi:hypothetical protein
VFAGAPFVARRGTGVISLETSEVTGVTIHIKTFLSALVRIAVSPETDSFRREKEYAYAVEIGEWYVLSAS